MVFNVWRLLVCQLEKCLFKSDYWSLICGWMVSCLLIRICIENILIFLEIILKFRQGIWEMISLCKKKNKPGKKWISSCAIVDFGYKQSQSVSPVWWWLIRPVQNIHFSAKILLPTGHCPCHRRWWSSLRIPCTSLYYCLMNS